MKSEQVFTNRTEINYLKAAIKTAIDQHLATHPEITRYEITGALLGVISEYARVWSPVEENLLDAAEQSATFVIAMPPEDDSD